MCFFFLYNKNLVSIHIIKYDKKHIRRNGFLCDNSVYLVYKVLLTQAYLSTIVLPHCGHIGLEVKSDSIFDFIEE